MRKFEIRNSKSERSEGHEKAQEAQKRRSLGVCPSLWSWTTHSGPCNRLPSSSCQQPARHAFSFARPAKQTFDAEMVVEIRPVDAPASSARFPAPQVFGSSLQQRWIPSQRHTDDPAVHQLNGKGLSINSNILNLRAQRIHSICIEEEGASSFSVNRWHRTILMQRHWHVHPADEY